ncbi:regulation of nuclear pre-mRNA domain-containing protein 1A isoform X1 [Spatholobus suberectus]|nr:regulation of nuclear pre-mRNA domain-containing protein 1A isoform X1 [Spatholobus suberectus]
MCSKDCQRVCYLHFSFLNSGCTRPDRESVGIRKRLNQAVEATDPSQPIFVQSSVSFAPFQTTEDDNKKAAAAAVAAKLAASTSSAQMLTSVLLLL